MSATAAPAPDRSDFRTVTMGGVSIGVVTGVAVVLLGAAARCPPSPARSSWRRSPGSPSPSRSPPSRAARSPSSSRRSASSPSPARDSGSDGRRAPLARPSPGRRWVAAHAGAGMGRVLRGALGRRTARYPVQQSPADARRGRATLGPYALAGVALGLSTDLATQEVAAQWSLGGGVEWRPLGWLALGTEVRYRLEDRGPRGFWNPRSDARRGVSAVLGVSVGGGRRGGGRGRGGYGGPPELPPAAPPTTI